LEETDVARVVEPAMVWVEDMDGVNEVVVLFEAVPAAGAR
jgi:hypothetical protein